MWKRFILKVKTAFTLEEYHFQNDLKAKNWFWKNKITNFRRDCRREIVQKTSYQNCGQRAGNVPIDQSFNNVSATNLESSLLFHPNCENYDWNFYDIALDRFNKNFPSNRKKCSKFFKVLTSGWFFYTYNHRVRVNAGSPSWIENAMALRYLSRKVNLRHFWW